METRRHGKRLRVNKNFNGKMSAVSRNKYKTCGFGTKSIHAGQSPNPITGAVMPGIELSSTFAQKSPGAHQRFLYSRISNPTREIMENLIAAVENGKYGIAFGSGCAATASTTSILETGSHIFSIDDVYGGTHKYCIHPQTLHTILHMCIHFQLLSQYC